ncbi:hypothetical protein GCM10009525_55230 [Streptosporangium amethystogenes subsp. fukuiense]
MVVHSRDAIVEPLGSQIGDALEGLHVQLGSRWQTVGGGIAEWVPVPGDAVRTGWARM